jgi:predicted RNase H-like HicB family nuclease
MVIYWSQEDRAFIVELFELSGCMADGRTYHEAVANTEVIINGRIKTAKALGRFIARPKGNSWTRN